MSEIPCGDDASVSESKSVDGREIDEAASSSLSSSSRPSETDWKPCSQAVLSVQDGMMGGISPRDLLQHLAPHVKIDGVVDDCAIWQVIVNLLTEPPLRSKLSEYNSLDDAVQLLRSSSKIIVLTGAGVSVSCGIPDFRSRNGIYARLRHEFPDLPNPESMFDLEYFKQNPRPFYEFARDIFPGQYQPSLCHHFVRELESQDKLLRNYTQNIDHLEKIAGIRRVVQCHGSFATASCCACKHKVDSAVLKEDIFAKKIPRCSQCPSDMEFNFMKPDIVFFGEDLPGEFHEQFTADKEQVDLLIVIGSSLKVRPVALVPNCVPHSIPQILINREPLQHFNFDIELLGNCDNIVSELCRRLGDDWTKLCADDHPLQEVLFTGFTNKTVTSADNDLQSKECESIPPKRARIEQPELCAAPAMEKAATKCMPSVEELRKMYKPRLRNLASELEDSTYFHVSPNRYVFVGAEVFMPLEDEDSSTSSSSPSSPLSPVGIEQVVEEKDIEGIVDP